MSGLIDLSQTPAFPIGEATVLPAELAVVQGDARHELQPKVMQVLVALAEDAPGVVSRDRLIERCWNVRAISDDAINRCILALRTLAQQFDPPPFAIETIPRVGHRMVANGHAHSAPAPASVAISTRKSRVAAIALAAVAIFVAILAWRESRTWNDDAPTLAVLPFRDLSGGDGTLATGISEDVLAELGAGREFVLKGGNAGGGGEAVGDVRVLGKRLGVDYLVEGTVRSQPDKVRVTAALIDVETGRRVWSDDYNQSLADAMVVQQSVGQLVAGNVRRALGFDPRGPAARLKGRSYAGYLEALGILRAENPEAARLAEKRLAAVVRDEPRYAPAWLALSEAIMLAARAGDADALIEALPRAKRAARTAVRLAPQSSAAHVQLATVLGGDSPEAVAHLRKATELPPRSAADYSARAFAHASEGRDAEGLEAHLEAQRLDPFQGQSARAIVDFESLLSKRPVAEAAARRAFADDPATLAFALGRIAWFYGDLSDAAASWRKAAATSARFSRPAARSLADLDRLFGKANPLSDMPTRPTLGHDRYRPREWVTAPPTPEQWRAHNRSAEAALVHHNRNILDAKMLLRAGRGREMMADWDSPHGLLGVFRQGPLIECQLYEVPLVILALRQAGRTKEAANLLHQARVLVRKFEGKPRKTRLFQDDAAAIDALAGDPKSAVARLERARKSGWLHLGSTDLPRIEDEPAFGGIAATPEFRALAARYRADIAREAREFAALDRT